MRFKDWDCIICPLTEKTPLPEFRTDLFYGPDPDKVFSGNNVQPHHLPPAAYLELPTVKSFIPMLAPGSAFKISLYSWTEPKSSLLPSLGPGQHPMFETRVYIDGTPLTYVILPANNESVPLTIDGYPGPDGLRHMLKFPFYHGYNVTMPMDRLLPADCSTVKIVLSEGIMNEKDGELKYNRSHNLVAFSFSYAPAAVLQQVGLMFPSPQLIRGFNPNLPNPQMHIPFNNPQHWAIPPPDFMPVPPMFNPSLLEMAPTNKITHNELGSTTEDTSMSIDSTHTPPKLMTAPAGLLPPPPEDRIVSVSDMSMPDYSTSASVSQDNASRRVSQESQTPTVPSLVSDDKSDGPTTPKTPDTLPALIKSLADLTPKAHIQVDVTAEDLSNAIKSSQAEQETKDQSNMPTPRANKDKAHNQKENIVQNGSDNKCTSDDDESRKREGSPVRRIKPSKTPRQTTPQSKKRVKPEKASPIGGYANAVKYGSGNSQVLSTKEINIQEKL